MMTSKLGCTDFICDSVTYITHTYVHFIHICISIIPHRHTHKGTKRTTGIRELQTSWEPGRNNRNYKHHGNQGGTTGTTNIMGTREEPQELHVQEAQESQESGK